MNRGQIILKSPRKWLVRAFLGRDGLGKRHYTSKMVEGARREAEKELTNMLAEAGKNGHVNPNRLTVEAFYPDWLASKKGISKNTRSQYEERVKQDILPYLGKRLLKDLTPQLVQKWIAWLEEKGHSPRTVQYSYGILKQLLRRAISWHLLANLPTEGVELPKPQGAEAAEQKAPALSPAETQRLLASAGADDDPYRALWLTLLTAGLRPQEAFALDAGDLQGSVLSISKAAVETAPGRYVVGPTKTKKSRRTVAVPGATATALREHLKAHGIIAGLIFRNSAGGILDISRVRRAWKKRCEAAGVPVLHLYAARHTHATALLAAGVPLKVVSERLGHASVKITGDIYSHVLPEMDDRAAKVMEAMLATHSAGGTPLAAAAAQ